MTSLLRRTLALVLLLAPMAVLARAQEAGPPSSSPHAAARLLEAADDAQLPAWQREIMLQLAGEEAQADSVAVPGDLGASIPDGAWSMLTPEGRYAHCAIYDPLRDRMVVFGGAASQAGPFNDVWALSLSGTPCWTKLAPTGTPPSASGFSSTAIYDPVRDRMITYSGWGSTEVWALSLAGTPSWTRLTPAGTPPHLRAQQSTIYDPVRDRMLVFGGYYGDTKFNDVWALSLAGTPTWSNLTPAGAPPLGRDASAAIYDPVRDRMLLFGGESGTLRLNDTWALSLGDAPVWAQVFTGSKPAGRAWHAAIYDPVRDHLVISGGYSAAALLADTWSLSLTGTPQWMPISPPGAKPAAREYHSAIYDPVRDRMVIYGGMGGASMADVWMLSLADPSGWTAFSPSPRYLHSAIYDPPRERMVVFGGTGAGNEVWALSLTGAPIWTQLAPEGTPPAARYGQFAFYDAARDRMVVYGGGSGATPFHDVWALSLSGTPAWTLVTTNGAPPTGGSNPATYDPVHDRMVVYSDGSGPYDIWILTMSGTPTWTRRTTSGTQPRNRSCRSAIYDPMRDRMLVYGGDGLTQITPSYSHVWSLPLNGEPIWTELIPTAGAPGWRADPTAIYDPVRDRMVVYGGIVRAGALGDAWALPLGDVPAWERLPAAPLGRLGHSAIYDPVRDRMVVFGGSYVNTATLTDDLFALTWGAPVREVAIDIRPDDAGNAVNPGAHGVLPVAILSDEGFDATTVEPLSVKLAGAGVRLRPDGSAMGSAEDVNGDGRADLVVHVEIDSLRLSPADTVAKLIGSAPGNLTVRGSDRVRIVPDRPTKPGPAPLATATIREPALLGVRSLPGQGLRVSLAIRPDLPASLELLDVAGRRLERLRLQENVTGPSEERLGSAALVPGIYWVRLTQADRSFTRKVVLLR